MTDTGFLSATNKSSTESAADPLLEVKGLKKYFDAEDSILDRLLGTTTKPVRAVDDVSFSVPEGSTLGIVGESGCGKSTLGRTILGLYPTTAGSVLFEGEDVLSMKKKELGKFRRESHIIFQDPFASLNPRMTIGDIVREPLDIHKVGAPAERRERVENLIERVGLSVSQLDRYPHEFSGGQRQRISIARALAVEPKFLVLDEPVSSLDVSVQSQILNLLTDLQDELGLTYCFIAHDLSVVRYISDYVAIMYLGKIVEIGPTESIFTNPSHPYTKALLENIPRPRPEESEREVKTLTGTVPSPREPPSGCRFRTRCPSLIPPRDYEFEQDAWRAVANFRDRLMADDAEEVMQTLVDDDDSSKTIDAKIRDRWEIPTRLEDDNAEEVLSEVIRSIETEELERAQDLLVSEFNSPCEERVPELVETGESRSACLLHEQSAD